MSRQTGPFFLVGEYGNVCAYKMGKHFYFRQKSSLTAKRVKTSAAYRPTMAYAGLMGKSSVIASYIYASLPAGWKDFCMYRIVVSEAMSLLKSGKTEEEARRVLWERYLAEFEAGYREEDEFVHVIVKTEAPVIRKATDFQARALLQHSKMSARMGEIRKRRRKARVLERCYEELME